jgi:hypothetical protein
MSNKNTSSNNSSNSGFSYNTKTQNNHDFTDSINRSLDQTKDNINKSIEESKKQIPRYNDIVNSYQEQTLLAAREISENFIEFQKTIIRSIQSAWGPYQRNFNTTVNSWNSPEAVTNAYSRFVSNVADNNVVALRTTNNSIFSSLEAYKTTIQHTKDTTKQIFEINSKAAQTFEQNSREVAAAAAAAQDSDSRFNASINNNSGSSDNTTRTSSATSTTSSPAA